MVGKRGGGGGETLDLYSILTNIAEGESFAYQLMIFQQWNHLSFSEHELWLRGSCTIPSHAVLTLCPCCAYVVPTPCPSLHLCHATNRLNIATITRLLCHGSTWLQQEKTRIGSPSVAQSVSGLIVCKQKSLRRPNQQSITVTSRSRYACPWWKLAQEWVTKKPADSSPIKNWLPILLSRIQSHNVFPRRGQDLFSGNTTLIDVTISKMQLKQKTRYQSFMESDGLRLPIGET